MKRIKNFLVIASAVCMVACTSNTNQDKSMKNTTPSGDYSAGNSDSANFHDTIHPSQPNGMDTTGEQTGRMNNPASGQSQPKKDSTKK